MRRVSVVGSGIVVVVAVSSSWGKAFLNRKRSARDVLPSAFRSPRFESDPKFSMRMSRSVRSVSPSRSRSPASLYCFSRTFLMVSRSARSVMPSWFVSPRSESVPKLSFTSWRSASSTRKSAFASPSMWGIVFRPMSLPSPCVIE